MRKAFGEYQWAAGHGRYAGSLWLGGDHLLVIENSGFILPFTESYRRIDYKNIQAITHARSKTGLVYTVLLSVLLAFLIWGIAANARNEPGLTVFFIILGVPVLLALITHLVLGPTCVCQVQTAVQILKLRPANRLRTAERLVALLEPLCRAHQADLVISSGPVAEAGAQGAPPVMPMAAAAAADTALGPKIKPPWTGSPLVTWALIITAIASLTSMGELFVKGMPYYFVDVLLTVTSICLIVASAARISRHRISSALGWSVWGNVVLSICSIIIGYGMLMYAMVKATASASRGSFSAANASQFSMWKEMANADLSTYGGFGWVLIGMSATGLLLALIGLPAAQGRGREAAISTPPLPPAPPPPPPPPPLAA